MQHVIHQNLWRANFIDVLQLLGQATARLPLGAPDPVLCGDAAVEFYTGSLWPTANLAVYAPDPRPLTAELFALGFRWTEQPHHAGRGLWHPDLLSGIDIVEDRAPLAPAELSNVLSVVTDLDHLDRTQVTIKVLGIEDLIAEQIAGWLARRAPSGEAAALVDALVELARTGVGGTFRAGYLQRRLAWQTGGEVVFETASRSGASAHGTAPRITTLTRVQASISVWCARCGFVFHRATSQAASREAGAEEIRDRNDKPGRAGGTNAPVQNVIPFDAVWPVSSR